jgi:uncharacterized protein YuzE
MRIWYDGEADALYVLFREVQATDSLDVEEGVTVELDEEGHIVGLEILDASGRLGRKQLHTVTLENLAWESTPA